MSMSQTLAPHLPYLRRYARALTGAQASGDAHVRAALTALLEGGQSLMEGVPPRVGLYRLFHAIWQSGAEHYDETAGLPDGMEQAVQAHPRRHPLHKALPSLQKRRQGGADMGIPAGLRPG